MLVFKPSQRWYSTAEPELGLGTILRAENRQVDIIFTGSGELKHYTQTSAPLVRCAFSVGDYVSFENAIHRIESMSLANDIACYHINGNEIFEGALDSEQTFIPASIRLLLNHNDQSHLFNLRKNALLANQLNQVDFEHFVVELLGYYGCQFTPQSTHSFLLDASQLSLNGFDHLKLNTMLCSFAQDDADSTEPYQYIDAHYDLYLTAKIDLLESQKGNASFLIDDRLPARSAVLETVYVNESGHAQCFAIDAKLNFLSQFMANEQALFRAKLSTIDLTPYKRSLSVILPTLLEHTMLHADSLNAGKLQALRMVAGSEFALFGKNKR